MSVFDHALAWLAQALQSLAAGLAWLASPERMSEAERWAADAEAVVNVTADAAFLGALLVGLWGVMLVLVWFLYRCARRDSK